MGLADGGATFTCFSRAIEVERTVELGVGGDVGVDVRCAQKVERDFGLGQELVPEVEGEVLVDAAEASDEVVLERADGAFGRVAAMHASGRELEVDALLMHELLEDSRTFVVQALWTGLQASLGQMRVENLVRGEDAFGGAVLEGLGEYGITIIVA